MKIGKGLLLLILLGAPILTYIFLKSFGRNYYDLPRFNPTAITNSGDTIYATLPAELGRDIFQKGKSIYLLNACFDTLNRKSIEKSIVRILDFYQQDSIVSIVFFAYGLETSPKPLIKPRDLGVEKNKLLCDFLFGFELPISITGKETIPECQRLILMDSKGYIRGVYAIENMEETDRLILEIKVLKSQLQ